MLKNKSFLSAAILFAVLETPCLLPSISFGMDPKEEQPPVSLSASSRVSSNPSFDETTSRALDLFRAPGKSLEERQKALGMIPEELRKDPSFLRHLEGIIGNFIEGPDVPLEQCIGYVANFITYPNQETLRRASNFLFFHLMLPHLQISPDSRKGILRAIIKKNGYGDQVNRAGYIFLMDMGGQFKLSEEETFNICQDVLKRACSLQYLLPIERLTALILDFSNALSLQQRIKGAESILLSSTVTPFEDAADRKKAEKEFGDFRVGLLHELVLKFAASADLDLIGVRAPAIRIAIKQNTDARVTTRAYAILKDLSLGEMERLFREDDFLTFLKSRMPYSYGFSSRYDDSAIAIITSCLKNPAFSSDQRVAFFQALTEKWDLYPQPFIVSAVREVFNPLMKDPKLSYPHKRAVFDSFIKAP